jgi:pimeloyl-ACP methyl ester carboxylesterase
MAFSDRVKLSLLVLAAWLAVGPASSWAQRSGPAGPREDLKLTTKDGVKLAVTYYPSSLGKEAVPIVMLHDFKESRTVFNGLAEALQAPADGESDSRAVITVDLRGHGESTVQVSGDGRTRDLEASRLGVADFQAMWTLDLDEVRKFLVEKNDAGKLNLNSLCLLGSGMGANVAAYWAAYDWSFPQLPTRKQGQDVKALILASPEWSFRGLPLLRPLRQPGVRKEISFFIVYGDQDSRAKKDASTVFKNLEKYHPEPPRDKARELKDLFLFPLPTKLQGTTLLTTPEFRMLPALNEFLDARLTQRHFQWVSRKE